jgi:hypothetical protein
MAAVAGNRQWIEPAQSWKCPEECPFVVRRYPSKDKCCAAADTLHALSFCKFAFRWKFSDETQTSLKIWYLIPVSIAKSEQEQSQVNEISNAHFSKIREVFLPGTSEQTLVGRIQILDKAV